MVDVLSRWSRVLRGVSTLLYLIQTKVNYVVQEAVVIKDIFRKYPIKYESIYCHSV